jgi:hypothetical protein
MDINMDWSRLPYKINRALKVYSKLYIQRQTPILIYTPGRVGSTGLYMTLDTLGQFVVHIHTLNAQEIHDKDQPGTTVWAYNHIIQAQRTAKIITLVRDPVSLIISDFFNKLKWLAGAKDAYNHLSVDELCELFRTRYFDDGRHITKLEWYETEFNRALNVDVYAHPFDVERGVGNFHQGLYDVLILRTETDDSIKAQAVSDFLGIPPFDIQRVNEAGKRDYAKIYDAFKKQITLPKQHLDTIYNSAYVTQFFTEEERLSLRDKWSDKVST